MQPINSVLVAGMLSRTATTTESVKGLESVGGGLPFGSLWWFIYAGFSCFFVLFAGMMSGLTLGLMSLGLVELEILQRSGTPTEKKQAAAILPVVQKQHQLLVTLLLCNAVAMEALPIYLDKLFNEYVAIILSVTFVLAFGEVIPQALCTRYGLAIGANLSGLVRVLMILCFPIAYPVGKVLDWMLGHNEALFRRAQLKALVSIHSQEAGKGGELTHDETTIISGALDLTEKTAEEAMTPIESTFSLDVNSKLDWVPSDMPLYDILNEFQKGSSHMAAVVRGNSKNASATVDGEKSEENNRVSNAAESQLTTPLLPKQDEKPESVTVDIDKSFKPPLCKYDAATNGPSMTSEDIEDGEVIGIITLEDVFEELLQEEIVDETDEYVDVHKRIRVAAAAAASSVARAPSSRRLTVQKGVEIQSKQGQGHAPKKLV
ncbi:hypothetical protein ES319_A02G034400v1 [Gossypium barbadense]|uniref:CNNM transmembrane domain-containing protein n=2 Tax=Gossypium barbadense TaxID=3634 RepID=A0A5J5WK46_GOSBA|nr:hypothetical protein ES319_A02G034400v1 [Gossypium barbadense]